jgi:competence protein ComEA
MQSRVRERVESRLASRLERWRADPRVAAAVFACVALAAGAAWLRAGTSTPAPPRAAPPSTLAGSASVPATVPATAAVVIVDVTGAVRAPGVVELAAGARVVDAIGAAGGPAPDADLARLNLAAPVADGTRIAVPAAGKPAPTVDPGAVTTGTAAVPGTDSRASGVSGPAAAPVNLNRATSAELDALPGIGPATAAAIIRDREAHGPFTSVDDLTRVRGIGEAKLAQLRDLVTV